MPRAQRCQYVWRAGSPRSMTRFNGGELSEREMQEENDLIGQYERVMLIRARACGLAEGARAGYLIAWSEMSRTYISKALREIVAAQAKPRCGYYLTPEFITGAPLEVDHVIPEANGGPTVEDNLWLACTLCNQHKADREKARDPESGDEVTIFDPRHQVWREHFTWSEDGALITGLTAVGRATVRALARNRRSLVQARGLWVSAGWHPPSDM